jgi:hypothetical protein
MNVRPLVSKFWIGIFLSALSVVVSAREFEGVDVPEVLAASETRPAASLFGVALREKFFVDVYVAALYAEQRVAPDDMLLSHQFKRMQFFFLYKELPQQKMADAWREAFEANLDADGAKRLKPRLDAFIQLHDATYRKGEQLVLDLIPGTGVRVISKGVDKGVIEGDDFAQAVLSAWLGRKPPSSAFKKSLLGSQ